MRPSDPVPLSQQPIDALRARSDELRHMAQTASTETVRAALLRLASRFDALAEELSKKPPAKG